MQALVVLYVAAVGLANLICWAAGSWAPWVSLLCGFGLIGLDMVIKDTVQERWGVGWRLALLVVGGGLAAFLAPGSARICGASVAAFVVGSVVDLALFAALIRSPFRYVASNTASALVDSALFLWLGLGVLGWPVLAQAAAKIAGAALWQRFMHRRSFLRAAHS